MGQIQVDTVSAGPVEPLRLQLESFVGCVRDGENPVVSGEDACRVLEIAHEIGQRIMESLPEDLRPVGASA